MLRPPSILASLATLASLALLAPSAGAQVVPIGPFTGSQSEGFETQINPGFTACVNGRVFNATADLCTPGNNGCSITTGWSFICTILPHSGAKLFGSAGGFAEYTFDTPAQRFGGQFGVNYSVGNGIAIFFDTAGNQLASLPITAPANCTWNWNGWDAGAGPRFKRVQIYGPAPLGGGFMMMDDMQEDGGSASPGIDLCQPGVGVTIPCPCANPPSSSPRGCDNSSATGGAQLTSSGTASLSSDTIVFVTNDEKPTALSIVLQGTTSNPGGLVFGQGIRCTTGALKRLYQHSAVGGSITAPSGADPSVSSRSNALGDPILAGQSRWYSVYYRDPIVLGGCPAASTFNITQTQEVAWGP
jgi:hypothetical protein